MSEGTKTNASQLLVKHAEFWASDIKNEDAFAKADNEELFMLLAARTSNPVQAFGPPSDRFKADFEPKALVLGPAFSDVGKKIFRRCASALHDFLCSSDDEDKELRDKIKNAITSPDVSAISIIAGGLMAVSALGATGAIVIATLINRIIVAPTAQVMCEEWDNQIKAASKPTANSQ